MRIRSYLFMGIGYLAGTRAGREKFEELKNGVQGLAQSDVVAGALERARDSFGRSEEDTEIVLPEDDEAIFDEDDEYEVVDEDSDEYEDANA